MYITASVIHISKFAFNGANSLTNLTFFEGSKLVSIGDSAFYAASALLNVSFPASLESIGSEAFYGNEDLIIYTELTSKPEEWDLNWNLAGATVIWDYQK